MPLLDLFAILCIGLMIGNELAVSLFVNPALWKLDESSQARALSLLAGSLGKVMPFWYLLGMLLLVAEAYVPRHGAHPHLLHAAIGIWAVAILYTVTLLVPINNRIAALNQGSLTPRWREEHQRWDRLHHWRIVMLVIAMACLVWSIVA